MKTKVKSKMKSPTPGKPQQLRGASASHSPHLDHLSIPWEHERPFLIATVPQRPCENTISPPLSREPQWVNRSLSKPSPTQGT